MTVIAQTAVTDQLLGPLGMAALALIIIGLLVRGTIHSRNVVPREDYEKSMALNASYAEAIPALTQGMKDSVGATNDVLALLRMERAKNGGS